MSNLSLEPHEQQPITQSPGIGIIIIPSDVQEFEYVEALAVDLRYKKSFSVKMNMYLLLVK